jgi:hypothetical protein
VPPRTPGQFRKLDAIAVLTGPLLPAPYSLEIYSRLALPDAQASYDGVIGQFPV